MFWKRKKVAQHTPEPTPLGKLIEIHKASIAAHRRLIDALTAENESLLHVATTAEFAYRLEQTRRIALEKENARLRCAVMPQDNAADQRPN